jgi:hypothetical protein
MSKGKDRTVYRRKDGNWVNQRNDADKASSVHETQKEANDAARQMLRNQGGGELTTMGRSRAKTPSPRPPTRTRRRTKNTEAAGGSRR